MRVTVLMCSSNWRVCVNDADIVLSNLRIIVHWWNRMGKGNHMRKKEEKILCKATLNWRTLGGFCQVNGRRREHEIPIGDNMGVYRLPKNFFSTFSRTFFCFDALFLCVLISFLNINFSLSFLYISLNFSTFLDFLIL